MKAKILRPILGSIALSLVLGISSACLVPTGAGIVVGDGPPSLRVEAVTGFRGPGEVWVSGYWDWGNQGWFWVPGSYVREPHSHASWVSPRYAHRHGRWYYTRGHWR